MDYDLKGLAKAGSYLAVLIVVALLAAGVLANSLLPLYPVTSTITVKNITTGNPVAGASVECWVYGILRGTGITDSNGIAKVDSNTNMWMTFIVKASGYEDKTEQINLNAAASATIFITPNGSNPNYITIKIYTVTLEGYVIRDVKIWGGASVASTNSEGYAYVLCEVGSVAFTFDGSMASYKRDAVFWDFFFGSVDKTLVVESGDVFTAYLPSGAVIEGAPKINDTSYKFWKFLFDSFIPGVPNWALLVLLFILIQRR